MKPLHFKSLHPLLLVGGLFLLVVLFINPLRETAISDDWAYALTVKHLVETGHYQLHDWLAANMPFQALWGAIFSRLFGFSHSTLRVSTLVLAGVGLVSFYFLAREHALDRNDAGFLALVFISSTLILEFSFTFMTEIPYLSTVVLSLALYTRALRRNSVLYMLLGSAIAGAAILTRQFGAAIFAGLGLVWLLRSDRWRLLGFFASGLVLPGLAIGWQLYAGTVNANWTARWLTADQAAYLKSSIFLFDLFWRPTIILQYLALFSLPLVILALIRFTGDMRRPGNFSPSTVTGRLNFWLLTGFALFIVVTNRIGKLVMNRNGKLPYIPWNFEFINGWPRAVSGLLTLLTVAGAFLLFRIVVMRYLNSPTARPESAELLLDFVTVFFLAEQLTFLQFGDEYLLPLLPFTLIVAGRYLSTGIKAQPALVSVGCACSLVVMLVAALWTRETLSVGEAQWRGSEILRQKGVKIEHIFSSWEWELYNGSFDRYLASLSDPSRARVSPYIDEWRPKQLARAQYVVAPIDQQPLLGDPHWLVVDQIPYRDSALQLRNVYIFERVRR